MSFATTAQEVEAQHGLRVSDTTLNALVQRVGGVAHADQQRLLDELEALPPGIAREDRIEVEDIGPNPDPLCVSTDGITYATRLREPCPADPKQLRLIYQEMKCGCVFWKDKDESIHKRVVYGRDDPERFGLAVWARAVQCGLLQAPRHIYISDGGGWCETIHKKYFADGTRIIDFFHLSEYVWAAAHGLYSDEKKAAQWAKQCLGILKRSSGMRLLTHLQRGMAARGEAASAHLEPLHDLISYLEPRVPYTDYSDYTAKGFPIGSGMMESTCKQTVGLRLKGSGRQWSERGALAMTALNAHRLNDHWTAFWSTKPQRRAA